MIMIKRISHYISNIVICKNIKRSLSYKKSKIIQSNENKTDKKKVDIYHSEFLTIKKSKFQAHLCKINNLQDIYEFKEELLKNRKIKKATHNILVYRLFNPNTNEVQIGSDDDGELGAGKRLEYMINILKPKNVAIIVTRWFGGILLGPCIHIM